MAEYKDYYRTLGVSRDADEKEIKKAFRKLARQYHPDVNPGDKRAEERFKEINEAYEVLGDSQKRAQYDRLGRQYQQWQRMGGQGSVPWDDLLRQMGARPNVEYQEYDDSGRFSDFFDILSNLGGFGGGARRQTRTRKQPIRGRDVEQEVTITLHEAYHGTTRVVERGNETLNVRIPPGAKTGTRVRLSTKGERGYAGGDPGDLFLVVRVADDPQYERKGHDLYRDLFVDLYTAVLGGEVRVSTLDGDVRLRIPAGTQSGRVFRLSGRGMPHLRDSKKHGDLYARVLIQVPEKLSAEERRLFEELASLRRR